jgi:hypothetical protein
VSSNQLLAFLFGHTHGRLAGRRWLVFRYSGNELLIHRKPPSRAIYSPDYEASRPPVFRSGRSDHDQRAPGPTSRRNSEVKWMFNLRGPEFLHAGPRGWRSPLNKH